MMDPISNPNETETEDEYGPLENQLIEMQSRTIQKLRLRLGIFVVLTCFLAGTLIGVVGGSTARKIRMRKEAEQLQEEARKQEQEEAAAKEKETEDGKPAQKPLSERNVTAKINLLEQIVDEYFMWEADKDDLEDGIYKGMMKSLGDIYTEYYNPEELKEANSDAAGVFYGIGAYISIDPVTAYPVLSGIMTGTPAEEVGLRENDIIYKVNDEDVGGWELKDVVSHVKGPEGTVVHLSIYRDGAEDYLEFDVTRRRVESPTVSYEMKEDNIGYLRITEFDDVTYSQFEEALNDLRAQGMEGLILDVRSNPGGNLSTVCDICRLILPEGLIVYTEDKYGNRNDYTCDGEHEMTEPLVVLVNGRSASASEILSGAIKDHGIGTLVGTTTFGKGIVQRILPLSDGSAVKITVSNYFTPAGNNIHKIGIAPDVEVEMDADAYYDHGIDTQLEKAVEVLKGKMK